MDVSSSVSEAIESDEINKDIFFMQAHFIILVVILLTVGPIRM